MADKQTEKAAKAEKPAAGKAAKAEKAPAGPKMKQVMRFLETNLEGRRPVERALWSIRGIGQPFAHAVAHVAGFGSKPLGDLSEAELRQLEGIIAHPEQHDIPAWLLNRRRDPATGATHHVAVSQLDFLTRQDINAMKKIRTYKGVRHGLGLPVRGQRTRSSGRGKMAVGVQRTKLAPAAPAKEK